MTVTPPQHPGHDWSATAAPGRIGALRWLIGGLAVVLLCASGGLAWWWLTPDAGTYSASHVDDACDLVDRAGLRGWAGTPDGKPDAWENHGRAGSDLRCSVSFSGGGSTSVSFEMWASTGEHARKAFEDNRLVGPEAQQVAGLGDEAYGVFTEATGLVRYELNVLDDNLHAVITVNVDGGTAGVSEKKLQKVCTGQIHHLMSKLR